MLWGFFSGPSPPEDPIGNTREVNIRTGFSVLYPVQGETLGVGDRSFGIPKEENWGGVTSYSLRKKGRVGGCAFSVLRFTRKRCLRRGWCCVSHK